MSLYIKLPMIDESWIEQHLTELFSMGTDILHSTEPKALAFNLNCKDFEEAFKNVTDDDCEYFYAFSGEAEKAEAEIVRYIEYFFKEEGLWNNLVDTVEKIGKYNECVSEMSFTIAETYGQAWIEYLNLKYDHEKEGVA